MTQLVGQDAATRHPEKTFILNIEGTEHEWHHETITTEQIAQLGGWDPSAGVIEIDKDNNERQLRPNEVVHLKPGHGFSRKIRWKRGDSLFDARLDEEVALLLSRFPDTRRNGCWFLLPGVVVPAIGWNRQTTDIALRAQAGHPGTPPYGIYVPAGLRIHNALPDNYQEPVGDAPPFEGAWGLFSWTTEDGEWRPAALAAKGSNMLNFALSALVRLQQGK